jgi:hypothetical protein
MQIDFEKQDGQWRVLGFRATGTPPPPPAGSAVPSPSPSAASSGEPAGALPSRETMNAMVEDVLLRFNDAVQQRDFTALHDSMAKPMREKHSAADLLSAFHTFVDKGIDISWIQGETPKYEGTPTVEKTRFGRMLTARGQYGAEGGRTVTFTLSWMDEGGRWALGPIQVDSRAGDGASPSEVEDQDE